MRMRWSVQTLRLREPFRISRSVMSERQAVRVEFEHAGVTGFGEVVTSVYYGLDADRIVALLSAVRPHVEAAEPAELLRNFEGWTAESRAAPGVLAAVDAALHDLLARVERVPVHALLGLPAPEPTPTARTIGIGEPEAAANTAVELAEAGFRVLKLKLSGVDEEDFARLAAVRSAAPDGRLLLDPNGAWTPEQAVAFLDTAQHFRVDAVEQPVRPGSPADLAWVARRSPVPVIADEDAGTIDDVRELGDSVHGINIKLAKCGGLRAALEIIDVARDNGLDIMLGCLVASSLGLAPAVQLTGLARWVDLDGHLLLAHDPWTGLGGADGVLRPSGEVGLGVRPVVSA